MKITNLFRSIAAFVLVALSSAAHSAEKPEALAGTWSCVSGTVNGKPLSEATTKLLRLTLTQTQYKTEKGNEVLFDSTYTIDSSKTPKEINMVGTEGDLAGKEAKGIYQLQDDLLKMCYTLPGKTRPKSFESTPGSEAYFIIWKRQPVVR